jgi:hypothetical protein
MEENKSVRTADCQKIRVLQGRGVCHDPFNLEESERGKIPVNVNQGRIWYTG